MQGQTKERWQELCAFAATEQDPAKLLELIQEINQLLEEKQRQLNHQPNRPPNPPGD